MCVCLPVIIHSHRIPRFSIEEKNSSKRHRYITFPNLFISFRPVAYSEALAALFSRANSRCECCLLSYFCRSLKLHLPIIIERPSAKYGGHSGQVEFICVAQCTISQRASPRIGANSGGKTAEHTLKQSCSSMSAKTKLTR